MNELLKFFAISHKEMLLLKIVAPYAKAVFQVSFPHLYFRKTQNLSCVVFIPSHVTNLLPVGLLNTEMFHQVFSFNISQLVSLLLPLFWNMLRHQGINQGIIQNRHQIFPKLLKLFFCGSSPSVYILHSIFLETGLHTTSHVVIMTSQTLTFGQISHLRWLMVGLGEISNIHDILRFVPCAM